MRIIAFSDLHSHTHDDFSYQLDNGMNSRLWDCLNVIDRVMHYRDKYGCDLVLNAGDTFHVPLLMDTVVFQETYKRLEKLADTSNRFIVLAGNHDMAAITRDGDPVSTVYALGSLHNTEVMVGKYVKTVVDDTMLHCIPYIRDHGILDHAMGEIRSVIKSKWFRSMHHIIVTHIGLDEAVNGPNEIKLKGEYSISKLRKLGADAVLCGHHHHPQRFPNVHVIGSPLQHNMLDRGDRRGLLIYDTKTKESTRIWLKNSRFFLYEIKTRKDFKRLQQDQEKIGGGYVRVLLDDSVVPESKVVDVVAATARMYKIIPIKMFKSGVRSEAITSLAAANIGNLSAVVPDYIDHIDPPNLNRSRLITIGNKLLG